jgi:hypothetical protein
LAVSVGLLDLAAFAVADDSGQAVAGLLDGELAVHPAPVGVIDRVNEAEQVHRLVNAPVLGERLPERGGMSGAAEHPQQVISADLVGDQGAGHPKHVRPLVLDLGQIHAVAGDRLQRPVVAGLPIREVRPPEPLVG